MPEIDWYGKGIRDKDAVKAILTLSNFAGLYMCHATRIWEDDFHGFGSHFTIFERNSTCTMKEDLDQA